MWPSLVLRRSSVSGRLCISLIEANSFFGGFGHGWYNFFMSLLLELPLCLLRFELQCVGMEAIVVVSDSSTYCRW